jgi:hypothetical protein
MDEITQFKRRENNDNQSPQVGDWVKIKNEGRRQLVARHLDSDKFTVGRIEGKIAYLVARTDYKRGMDVPIRPLDIKPNSVPAWGVSLDELQIEYKPKVV